MNRTSAAVVAQAALVLSSLAVAPASAAPGASQERRVADVTTARVSVDSSGQQAYDRSNGPKISADGRYVVFDSHASNLVADDTNGWADVFVRDLMTGVTRRVSVTSSEGQANRARLFAAVSADGRYVAFASDASNLVAGDTNHTGDVFVRDLVKGVTRRVSVSSNEGQTTREGWSGDGALSADGRYVVFSSAASNLVPGDTNHRRDVFVRDLMKGVTRRVSVTSS